jgi:pyruvate dehydrogenase E1 component alpha subunit
MPPAVLLRLYRQMLRIRRFEERVNQLFLEGRMPGTLHLYVGQEACAVGVCEALQPGDWTASTHRPHGHAIAKGVSLDAMMAELFGKTTGCAGGFGGSMHTGDPAVGALTAIAIVGGNVPVATGMALSSKLRRTGQVVACFTGDGAVNEGAFHEGANMAAIWDLPVVFVCENNLYGASTPIGQVVRLERLSDRAQGYGIPGITVDGMDVLAVHAAATAAVERARSGAGPTFLECETYRFVGHSRSDTRGYRTREEEEAWKERDPIPRLAEHLRGEGLAAQADLHAVAEEVAAEVEQAVAFAEQSPPPAPEDCLRHVFAATSGAGNGRRDGTFGDRQRDPEQHGSRRQSPAGVTMTIAEALREALREEMRRDERVFCLGEDIGIPGGFGGAFTVTLGLADEFGHERILDTPISEAGIVGAAVGAALMGMRPVADVQYADFLFCAMDQIVNQAAKLRYMSGGKVAVPMVLRAPCGATTRAAQHSQSPESFFLHVPGLKVACPCTAHDAKGLLKTAIRDDDPVIFFEHKLLYGSKGMRAETGALSPVGEVPAEEYTIPFGEAVVRREGADVTIVAKLLMVYKALAAAEELTREGISCEVIDPRTLVPFDWETVVRSVRKTEHLVIVDECPRTGGWAATVAAEIQERAFGSLDAPIRRVTAPDTPVPFAPVMERYYVPDETDIARAVQEVLRWR